MTDTLPLQALSHHPRPATSCVFLSLIHRKQKDRQSLRDLLPHLCFPECKVTGRETLGERHPGYSTVRSGSGRCTALVPKARRHAEAGGRESAIMLHHCFPAFFPTITLFQEKFFDFFPNCPSSTWNLVSQTYCVSIYILYVYLCFIYLKEECFLSLSFSLSFSLFLFLFLFLSLSFFALA